MTMISISREMSDLVAIEYEIELLRKKIEKKPSSKQLRAKMADLMNQYIEACIEAGYPSVEERLKRLEVAHEEPVPFNTKRKKK